MIPQQRDLEGRRVHALLANGCELAHYEWNRHWYVERPDGLRHMVSLAEAVELAKDAPKVFLGLPGALQFDARLRNEVAR